MRNFKVTVNGNTYDVCVEELNATSDVKQAEPVVTQTLNEVKSAPVVEIPKANTQAMAGEKILAPMPGTIVDVCVKVGDSVKKGDVLVVLEAMKMENEIVASTDSKVVQILTSKGASVNTNDVLVVLG